MTNWKCDSLASMNSYCSSSREMNAFHSSCLVALNSISYSNAYSAMKWFIANSEIPMLLTSVIFLSVFILIFSKNLVWTYLHIKI